MSEQKYNFGMIGLGTMGCNLVLNMSDHGFSVAGYDKDVTKVDTLNGLDTHNNIEAFRVIEDFVSALETPRTILLLVPAGPIVDAVIYELKPLLEKSDIIIDCGNSHFIDTQLRIDHLAKDDIHFMGLGVSGGETGARFGPSIMPGGDKTAYARIEAMLQAVSAKVNDEPCTAYMGSGASGHYVKMVHNGIEYALMQLISESYHLLKVHGGFTNAELHDTFTNWNKGRLQSFLIEITAAVFTQPDEEGKGLLIDNISDTAHQKGTGAWMSQDAMKIMSPIPAVDAAVTQRILSSMKQERVVASKFFGKSTQAEETGNKETLAADIESALYEAFIITYAQGLAMLQQASDTYKYGIDIATVASIWRGGCIIRAAMLKEITQAFQKDAALKNLMLSSEFSETVKNGEGSLRRTVQKGLQHAIPLPAFSACINYYDSYFSEWLPANLIQAQRDFLVRILMKEQTKKELFTLTGIKQSIKMDSNQKTNPTIITIFGGSGDLTWRKLIPALYNLYLDHWLNAQFRIICTGRSEISNDTFIAKLKDGIDQFSRRGKAEEADWKEFSKYVEYQQADFTKPEFYDQLKKEIGEFEKDATCPLNKIFYMAVPPQFFETIAECIGNAGLADDKKYSRLVIEKPFGTDLDSAKKLNKALLTIFDETQLYRIDHYLGKETVQNILAFRFANALFEPTWNRNFIDHIQITVAEKIGIEDRGSYYEHSGIIRDMIQNHLMQLVCLIAMEPPVSFNADEVRNKKTDVLHAIRKIKKEEVHDFAVRGQYSEGWMEGEKVKGYKQEKDVDPNSTVPTFAAIKFYIDNWRWSGVPFYVRSGKRMQQSISVITIEFKPVPHQSFPDEATENWQPNRMVLNLQPDMGIRVRFQAKKPGLQMQLSPVDMLFNYNDTYAGTGTPEGYETLLLDVIEGDATLFMRADQVEAAWELIMPILSTWEDNPSVNFPNYVAGSYGPESAEALIAKDGHNWIVMPFEKNKHD